MKNLFFNPITKKLQSSTTSILDFKQQLPILASNNTPFLPAMGFKLMTPGFNKSNSPPWS